VIPAPRQGERLGPKFERLARTIADPAQLAELREDPAAIVPERALVFEVASEVADFHRALRGIGLELLGEDEGDRDPDDDLFLAADSSKQKHVPLRVYFTLPDVRALQELVGLWNLYQGGKPLGQGRKAWLQVFEHLSDIRAWGPRDRLTPEAVEDWKFRLSTMPERNVRLEVEFWFRENHARRAQAEQSFLRLLPGMGGALVHRAEISAIRYHAALVDVPPDHIRDLLAHPNVALVLHDDVMFLRPQAVVGEPLPVDPESAIDQSTSAHTGVLRPPVAALLDGLPMAQHEHLRSLLEIDDPDDLGSRYGSAREQSHGTAMASLILHGDLEDPHPVPYRLHVRPVMFPQPTGFDDRREERMPPDELVVDLTWRAFIRMKEGERGEAPTAPGVRVVNLSLGNDNQRFARTMSPWARLIDFVAWHYGVLVIVSAGNIRDAVPLPEVASWSEFEQAPPEKRQATILSSIVKQLANRQLLSPSEAINALTVGACHDDCVPAGKTGLMAVTAYASRFLPNPSSALGLGFRGSVKPDVLFPGGREQLRSTRSHAPIELSPAGPSRYFGVKTAGSGAVTEVRYVNGASCAAALATNSAMRILEALEALPSDAAHPAIDGALYGVLLKALLVHGAKWDPVTVDALKAILNPNGERRAWQHERDALSRFLGYGRPDLKRVLDCTAQRGTLLGQGSIQHGHADRFRVPLPLGLQGVPGLRALSVTIAWFTPVNVNHRMYRMAKLEASPGGDKAFSLGVTGTQGQPSHLAAARGTVFHRCWEGEEAVPFVDDGHLVIDVFCRASAGDLDVPIPYAVVVTLEVGQDVAVAVYDEIRARLRAAQRIGIRAP
jgi:hypothetical protein